MRLPHRPPGDSALLISDDKKERENPKYNLMERFLICQVPKIAIDLGKWKSYIVMEKNGIVVKEGHTYTTKEGFSAFFEEVDNPKIIVEASSNTNWVANMMKNHNLARSIGEESWGNFINHLQYTAESAGCVVVGVNPKDTSKTCSECGNIQDMLLFERTFHCQKCGMSKDRDLNASINILKRATSGQGGSHASGDIVSPSAMKADFVERGTMRVAS
jgi:IS605 OrfB family transposase